MPSGVFLLLLATLSILLLQTLRIQATPAAVVPLVEVSSQGSIVNRSPAITGPATEKAKNPGENGVIYPNGTPKKQKALTPVYSWSRQSLQQNLKKKKRSN